MAWRFFSPRKITPRRPILFSPAVPGRLFHTCEQLNRPRIRHGVREQWVKDGRLFIPGFLIGCRSAALCSTRRVLFPPGPLYPVGEISCAIDLVAVFPEKLGQKCGGFCARSPVTRSAAVGETDAAGPVGQLQTLAMAAASRAGLEFVFRIEV